MNKLYIFAIGGTGSRVLRSLTMMLAAGVKPGVETIIPIIIDPDIANADLTRTVALMNDYASLNKTQNFSEGAQSYFFKTKIDKKQKDFTLPFDNIGGVSFDSFLGLAAMDRKDQALVRMLFSQKNLDSHMDVGFKGNPNIGSVVLNQIFDSDEFNSIANSFSQGDEIFIVSSIFGGTGASGFPMLLKSLRTSDKFTNNDLINKANIGAVTILPYFKVDGNSNDDDKEIKSSTFISKTKSALSYYASNIAQGDAAVDDLYFLGDDINDTIYNYSEGGSTQKNNAHLIEFLAATAIIDYTLRDDKRSMYDPIQTRNYELGIRDLKKRQSVHFSSFYDELKDMLYFPLTQFAMMTNAFKYDYPYLKDTLAATKKITDFYSSTFIRDLKAFMLKYDEWLEEMDGNMRQLQLFNFNCNKKPLNLVQGIVPKSHWYSIKKDYEVLESALNRISVSAKKVEKDSNSSMFLEMFFRATKELVQKKLNN